ncbi:ubiquitin C-terminal hydrolase of the cysteine proteinase fold [Cryptosporidium ryanae]|uniref:ubiquitin C-terminal hydrolase of the cysteine proteinase fold n=1 Tax=Cryptosporidium ryanae TaxID=515981 RepID=UPI003519E7EA|nr:ubiquitin C-terminal hydrolase of the cysteine proteinase fold [Cryptosporidium ryanae]
MCRENEEKIWGALISDPDTLSSYSKRLGVQSKIEFKDLYSTEDWALELISGEPISIILLFPLNETLVKMRECNNDSNSPESSSLSEGVWFMRQYVKNSCGIVALIHSVLNNMERIKVEQGSFIHEISSVKDEGENLPEKRGLFLKENKDVEQMHEEITLSGQNCHCEPYEVDHHYISFIIKNDKIFELDGRLTSPINHGRCLKEDFLRRTVEIIKTKFINYLDESDNVAITVLTEDR